MKVLELSTDKRTELRDGILSLLIELDIAQKDKHYTVLEDDTKVWEQAVFDTVQESVVDDIINACEEIYG